MNNRLAGTGPKPEAVGDHSQLRAALISEHIVNKFAANLR
jgi:hypothetical protein